MWADAETDIDFLNYSEVAELVAEMIERQDLLPLSLGIFGTWGTGKSTTLKLVKAELQRKPDAYLIIDFDAWLYQDFDDARAALMAVIAKALIDASPPGLLEKANDLYKRVNKLRLLGLAAEGGAAAMGLPTFGFLSRGIEAVADAIAGDGDEEDVKALKDAGKEAREKTKDLVEKAEKRSPPEEITAFRRQFDEVLRGLDKTLIVFIDNLDRCLPRNAIHTLEAIRLFLFMPKTAFVIAADEDMIRHAVSQHFRNPSERLIADYLDKLIQIPVRVPRAGVQEVRAYTFLLFVTATGTEKGKIETLRAFLLEQLQLSWKPDTGFTVEDVLKILDKTADNGLRASLDLADRMAPLLALSARVQGNPRIIKRMLNVVQMRASIARKRRMPLDEAIIAKLALFERCTDAAATEALHNAINAAADGKPQFFSSIEARNVESASIREHSPEAWHNHMDFVRDWVGLEPTLGGVDLRPAVYLARETVPLRLAGSSLSPAALKAVEALRNAATVSSVAARKALESVDTSERGLVMDRLIAEMRRSGEWSRARSDFRGAVILADVAPTTGITLMRFISSLPFERVPPWMGTLVRDEPWFER
jgi:predicted KAP-like P-loop ATPase